MLIRPTKQQEHVVVCAQSGGSVAVEALAGTGKTQTLVMVAEALAGRGQYIAFNRAIVDDTAGKFPSTVNASTAHSLAFRAVGNAAHLGIGDT